MSVAKNPAQLGHEGEQLALDYLLAKNFVLLQRQFRSRWGEIDLVMNDGSALVFVEVKLRRQSHYGSPLEAISKIKQQRMYKTADFYLMKYPHSGPIRFDVVGIVQSKGQINTFEHVENAWG